MGKRKNNRRNKNKAKNVLQNGSLMEKSDLGINDVKDNQTRDSTNCSTFSLTQANSQDLDFIKDHENTKHNNSQTTNSDITTPLSFIPRSARLNKSTEKLNTKEIGDCCSSNQKSKKCISQDCFKSEELKSSESEDLFVISGVKPKKLNSSTALTKLQHGKAKTKVMHQDGDRHYQNKPLTGADTARILQISSGQYFDQFENDFNPYDQFEKDLKYLESNQKADDQDYFGKYKSDSPKFTRKKDFNKIQDLKENVIASINTYKSSKGDFSIVYQKWLQTRKDTLEKLKTLIRDLHKDQLDYNKAQMLWRQAGFASRTVKREIESGTVGLLATFSAFLSDAASGITSVAQAFNVDSYQTQFQEILEYDAKDTKKLYDARSRCLVEYEGVEEVFRNFQSSTFNSTVANVSNALEVSKFWVAVKNANETDNMNKVVSILSNFVEKSCQSEVLGEVYNSVQTYVNDNPAALEACKSAGRAACGVIASLGVNKNRNGVRQVSQMSNSLLLIQDSFDIQQLQRTIENDLSQTKLEDQIEDAIDSMTSEMQEMIGLCLQELNGTSNNHNSHGANNFYEDDY